MDTSSFTAEESPLPIGAVSTPLSVHPKRQTALREAVTVFGIWTLIALVYATYYRLTTHDNQSPEFTRWLVLSLIHWNIMAGYTLVFLWMVRRWPLGAGHWRYAPMYMAVISVLVVVKYMIYVPIRAVVYPVPGVTVRHELVKNFFIEVFECAAIVGVVHAIEYARSLHEGRVRASQLESHLSHARLEVLRSELQPHFLFNALHAISTLMHRNVEAADEMVTQLADLLRLTLERKSVQEVPLREELSVLEPYLNILRIRFGDRLTISVDVDPSLLDVRVPLFVLQPLVENSIHHGIARRAGSGRIDIRARSASESVQITVADDGAGLDSHSVREGIGLSNTRLRLEHLYGSSGQLVLQGNGTTGARVVVTIPRSGRSSGERTA